jgi:hypothetical protein
MVPMVILARCQLGRDANCATALALRRARCLYSTQMLEVAVTVQVGAKTVALRDVKDARVRAGLVDMATNVARALTPVTCSIHKRGVRDVRIHLDAKGAADLRYDACCEGLRKVVSAAL